MAEESTREQIQQSIARRKNNSAIAIAADLANDNDNSICRIAIAWISGVKAHGLSWYVKPPTDDFSRSRKVTAEMVSTSPPFAAVWDEQIAPLLIGDVLAVYDANRTLQILKASYEASGKPFIMPELYIRDLRFLAVTYMPRLGNDSFISIIHQLQLSADLDDPASRAMACTRALDRMMLIYPASGYGVPLSLVQTGVLNLPQAQPEEEEPLPEEEEQKPLGERLAQATRFGIMPILIIAICLFGYYFSRQHERQAETVDFSSYSATEMPKTKHKTYPQFETGKAYTMMRGTYMVVNEDDINLFIAAAKEHDAEKIRTLMHNNQVIVFQSSVPIEVTGETNNTNGFVPITVKEGHYAGQNGYIPSSMIVTGK